MRTIRITVAYDGSDFAGFQVQAGPRTVQQALDRNLPADIVVLDLVDAAAGFHARYGARARSYRYTLWNAPERTARERGVTCHWRSLLDVVGMDAAAQTLVGQHDFAAFC